MKRFKVLLAATALTTITLLQPMSAFAHNSAAPQSSNFSMYSNEILQLQLDLAYINSIPLENLQEFVEQNQDWLNDVDNRLRDFMGINHSEFFYSNDPVDVMIEKYAMLHNIDIQHHIDTNNMARAAIDVFFHDHSRFFRSGYWTYGLDPRASVRLLRTEANNAWTVFSRHYSRTVDNHYNSLNDQFFCHFDFATFKDYWNIEEGRPDVGWWGVVSAGCNPV